MILLNQQKLFHSFPKLHKLFVANIIWLRPCLLSNINFYVHHNLL